MKKLFVTAILFCSIGSMALFAQDLAPNAIGFRFEGDDGLGPEISYQRALGGNNRLELDLGFKDNKNLDVIKLTGFYQWVWNISGGLNWYAGVGAGVGIVDYDPDFGDDSDIILTGDGIIGIEYSFRDAGVPIQLAIDLNPEVRVLGDNYFGDDLGINPALSIRFQF